MYRAMAMMAVALSGLVLGCVRVQPGLANAPALGRTPARPWARRHRERGGFVWTTARRRRPVAQQGSAVRRRAGAGVELARELVVAVRARSRPALARALPLGVGVSGPLGERGHDARRVAAHGSAGVLVRAAVTARPPRHAPQPLQPVST